MRHFFCGLAMGAADIVPGVSGGTVALILGIYERLVTAISRFDGTTLQLVLKRRIGDAARRIDLVFLMTLGAGIGVGVVGLASVMNELLTGDSTRPGTLAAFFGLILASAVLVARMALEQRATSKVPAPLVVAAVLVGAVFAFWLTGLSASGAGDPSLIYVFVSGAIAISAMILPGISGAFILVLLGMYVHVTGILKRLPRLDVTTQDVITVAVFCLGCGIGLLLFSRLLRFLLSRHAATTLAVLCGFMLGSLRKIWPFQRDVTLERLDQAGLSAEEVSELRAHPELLAEMEMKHRVFENRLPDVIDGQVLTIAGIAVAAAVFVIVVDAIVRRRAPSS